MKLAYGDGATPRGRHHAAHWRMVFSLPFCAVIGVIGWKASATRDDAQPSGRQLVNAVLVGLLG